jgi:hypothetical protein
MFTFALPPLFFSEKKINFCVKFFPAASDKRITGSRNYLLNGPGWPEQAAGRQENGQ